MFFLMYLFFCFFVNCSKSTFSLQERPNLKSKILTDSFNLSKIASDASEYLKKIHLSKFVKEDVGIFSNYGITLKDVTDTLDFISTTFLQNPKKLKDVNFFLNYFDFYRWYADEKTYKKETVPYGYKGFPDCIRTTSYRRMVVAGSQNYSKHYSIPIYLLPLDEKGYFRNYINYNKNKFSRYKYSFSEIINIKNNFNNFSKPLAFVSLKSYKELALQGSAIIKFKDGSKKNIAVSCHNGKDEPDRYWFCYEDDKNKQKINTRFPIKVNLQPIVSFAADIKTIGFGKLILLNGFNFNKKNHEINIGVLVDTGSVFVNNLSKLDIFLGTFENEEEYYEIFKNMPHMSYAYILIKKNKID